MTTTLSAICPCCKIEAKGDLQTIEKVFGVQPMPAHTAAKIYCSKCQTQKCTDQSKNCV